MCSDVTIDSVLHDQYLLSRYCNIGFQDSNMMAEFERKAIVSKLLKDKKREQQALNTK